MEEKMILIDELSIKDKIYEIRGVKVMLDFDLAEIYGYSTKAFNQQIRNNIDKFDNDFRFQLQKGEYEYILRSKNLTSRWGGSRYLPFAFTESGIYMLMTNLFDVDRSRVTRHLNAAIEDGEINSVNNVRKTHFNGIKKPVSLYNLDAIIAVGYRVKSLRGVIFRKWATTVLKNYMLCGYAVEPSRVLVSRENYLDLVNVVNRIDSTQTNLIGRVERLEDKYPELGQLYDAASCIEEILEQAHREIILIDTYVDRKTLDMLSRKRSGVRASIYTSAQGNRLTRKELHDFNVQYPSLDVRITDEFHDRFLILDRSRLFHIGASIKDAGSKGFEISENRDEKQLDSVLKRLMI